MKDTPFMTVPADQIVVGRVRKGIEKEGILQWIDNPIWHLVHEPTHTEIAVYKPINRLAEMVDKVLFWIKI